MNILSGPELVEHADKIAEAAHAGQLYGDRPYIVHPREVAAFARELGYPDEVIAGSLLHDTLEDTDLTPEDLLQEGMPICVVSGVVAVTWAGNGSLKEKIAQAKSDPLGHVIKFCDSSRNFATTANDPKALGAERARGNALRYASNLGELAIGLPTPEDILLYCRASNGQA